MKTRLIFALLLAVVPTVGANASQVTSVLVGGTPGHWIGPCPITIKFAAKVAVDGPASVQYRWVRGDGGVDTVAHPPLVFTTAGAKTVETTWTLGATTPAFQPFKGSMKLEVLSPKLAGPSEPALFDLYCQPGKPDLVPQLHQPMDGWVGVKNVGGAMSGMSMLALSCAKAGAKPGAGGCANLTKQLAPPFFAQGNSVGMEVKGLDPGEVFSAKLPNWSSLAWTHGTFTFTATADSTHAVSEGSETNNVATSTLTH